jgi:hypothetical protein
VSEMTLPRTVTALTLHAVKFQELWRSIIAVTNRNTSWKWW